MAGKDSRYCSISLRYEMRDGEAIVVRSFDAAFSANVFFFVEEPERALGELFRVLRPGGRLAIATMEAPLPAPSLRRWWLYGPMGRALRV